MNVKQLRERLQALEEQGDGDLDVFFWNNDGETYEEVIAVEVSDDRDVDYLRMRSIMLLGDTDAPVEFDDIDPILHR